MADNSSLYGSTPPSGSVSSSNYTTLYSGGNNFVPSGDNVIISGTLTVNGCSILTDCSAFNLLPFNATTVSAFGAATAVSIGGATGVTTIQNQLSTGNYLFPLADGTANQILATDGSGVLYWADVQTLDTNYTIDASATTGGANFNLQGSDSTTDTIKFANGSGVSVVRTDANTITITNTDPGSAGVTSITGTANQVIASSPTGAVTLSLPQDIATTSNPTFNGIIAGFVNIGASPVPNNVITTTAGSNADLVLYANGTGEIYLNDTTNIGQSGVTGAFKYNGFTSGSTTITAPTTGSDINWVLPNAQGAASTVLTNDGSGNLSWALPGGGGSTFGNITVAVVDDNTISTTTGNLFLTSATGVVEITNSLNVDSGTLFVDPTNNRVGVNTMAPLQELTVNAAGDGYCQIGMENTERTWLVTNNDGDDLISYSVVIPSPFSVTNRFQFDATGGDQWFNSGKLGVNNNAPAYELDVSGTGRFTNDLIVGTEIQINGATSGSTSLIQVDGSADVNYYLPTAQGASSTVLTNDGSGNLSWALPGGGGSTFGNITVAVVTDNTISTTTGDLVLDADSNQVIVDANLYVGTSFSVDNPTGNTETTGTGIFKNNTTGQVTLGDGSGNGSIEIGQGGRATSGTPFIDWHSSAASPDYDVRMLVSGGSATDGQGTLTITANEVRLTNSLTLLGSTSGGSTFTAPATGSGLAYILPGSAGAASTVLTNDGSGNLSWALPGGGGSTFGNITIAVDTDNTISTTTGDLVLDSSSGTIAMNVPTISTDQTSISLFPTTTTEIILGGTTTTTNVSKLDIDNVSSFDTATITTTSTATATLYATTRNAMTGLVNIKQGTNVHCVNFTALRIDATTAMLTTYAEMYNNIPLANFTADVSAGGMRLRVTPTSATSTVFYGVRTSLD